MIVRARSIITMDGPPIDGGAVAIAGAKIVNVGSWSAIKAEHTGDVLDLGDCVLMPGLINAHCHLDYTCLRGVIPPEQSFVDWIRAINSAKAALTDDDYIASIIAGFAEARTFGTTTLVNLEAFPHLLSKLSPPPLRTWWFAEMIDVRAPVSPRQIYEQMAAAFDADAGWLGGLGFAPHAPFTASKEVYARVGAFDLPMTTHLAESREEMAMFHDARGPLFSFMANIGRPMDDCGRATPLALLLEQAILDERWIVAHLNELTPDDFRLLKNAPRFHIAHCPRSHGYFGRSPFALQQLRDLGFNICVATDSLASNDDLSLLAELRQLATTEPTLSPQTLFEMVTVNPAAALRQQSTLGQIRTGFAADLIAVPFRGTVAEVFEETLYFAGKVPWTMVNGRPFDP